jgi:hypothetical protein
MDTALRCPMCGATNPVGNAYCDKCNARLVPMTAPQEEREPGRITGISLPTIPLEEKQQVKKAAEKTGAEEDWLTQLRAAAPDEARESEMPPKPAAVERGETGDWLTELRASAVEEAKSPAGEEETEARVEPAESLELPDWMQDLGPIGAKTKPTPAEAVAPEKAAPAGPTPAPAEVLDWLQEAAPAETAAPQEAAPAGPTPPLAEVPDWLQEAEAAAPREAAPAGPTPALVEIPDWLQEAAPAEAAAPREAAPAGPTPAPAEIPDWLQEAAPAETAAPQEAAPAEPTPALAGIPDWLQEAAPVEAAAPREAAPAGPTPAPAEIPDWLQEAAPAEAVAPEEAVPALTEVPDWLRDAAPAEMTAPEAITSAAEAPPEETALPLIGTPPPVKAEIPEWLRDIASEGESAPEAITPLEPGIGTGSIEGLARAQIPDWLQAMRPHGETAEAIAEEEEEEALETEGPLEGLRGALFSAPIIQAPTAREVAMPAEVSEASLARAQLLQSLISRPTEAPKPEVRKRGVSMLEWTQRLVVAAALLLPLIAILGFGFELPIRAQPGTSNKKAAQHLFNTIEGDVGVGSTVLVAFEYGPAEADELNQVAEPILEHLRSKEATISAASTRPEGLAMATGLLESIGVPEEQYPPPDHYRPGDATGVSQLLASVGRNADLILILTAQPAALRRWIEQAHSLGEDGPSVVVGTSTALEAVVTPYLDPNAGQLQGGISGLCDAAAYENLRGQQGNETTSRLNALAAGHAVVTVLMIVGAFLNMPVSLFKRDKREE